MECFPGRREGVGAELHFSLVREAIGGIVTVARSINTDSHSNTKFVGFVVGSST